MDNYDILRELGNVARTSQPFYTTAEYVPETPTILKSNGGPVDLLHFTVFYRMI